jgi:Putative Actinobacterial Holin-X, holin superfamily III
MPASSSGLLRAGLAIKLNHVKLAARSYLRDRTNHATGTVTSYAIGAGLFVAAGVFLIAACLVGAAALFRWIELKYGLFFAFGAAGGSLLMLAVICVAVATRSLKRNRPQFPSLNIRLRVAVRATPVKADQYQAARDATPAGVVSSLPPSRRRKTDDHLGRDGLKISLSLILAATLLSWAAARRWQLARHSTRG